MSKNITTIKIPHFVADNKGKYKATRALTEKQIFSAAKAILKKKFVKGEYLSSPDMVKNHLMFQYANYEYEVFICIFLDNQHRIIKEVEMFRGTIDGASVYPREVAKKALELNAAAVMFVHNHPSGVAAPSQADKNITERLKSALGLIEVRVLDHFIIAGACPYSFAECGLL